MGWFSPFLFGLVGMFDPDVCFVDTEVIFFLGLVGCFFIPLHLILRACYIPFCFDTTEVHFFGLVDTF